MRLCKCGCGKEVLKEKNFYINGHNNKGKNLTEVVKEKIRVKLYGKSPWNKGKTKNNSKGMLEASNKMKKLWKDKYSIFNTLEYKVKHLEIMNNSDVKTKIREKSLGRPSYNKGKKMSNIQKKKIQNKLRLYIEDIDERYPFFSQIEEMRYNPDKPEEKEIQVHCKNHDCINSKEKGGWFTPSGIQLFERIRQLENISGNGGSYLYCSEKCKQICPLYRLHADPYKQKKGKPYTQEEYQLFRKIVLKRDNYICQFCGDKATEVHHERPQKLEPFFALDPDYAWSCCKLCHRKFGHSNECSTFVLAQKVCI